MMAGADCNSLTFANCYNCTDVNPATAKAECTSCDDGYALKDDRSACDSMCLWLFVTVYQNTT